MSKYHAPCPKYSIPLIHTSCERFIGDQHTKRTNYSINYKVCTIIIIIMIIIVIIKFKQLYVKYIICKSKHNVYVKF